VTDGRLFVTGVSANIKVTWHKNWDKYKKFSLIKFRYCAISGQLPAPIVTGRANSISKWKDFQLWRALDLDLGSSDTAYYHASVIDLHAKFHSQKLFVNGRTDVLTNIRTDGNLRPTLLSQFRRVNLKTNPIHVMWLNSQVSTEQINNSINFWNACFLLD